MEEGVKDENPILWSSLRASAFAGTFIITNAVSMSMQNNSILSFDVIDGIPSSLNRAGDFP